ncbi:MAG: hypothetical protein H6900_02550 [Rhodobacter sp.]|nr:hypothetical protein [Rhodobacter sp.]HPD91908.1 hypothetical protein [Pararhodobacter sp.]
MFHHPIPLSAALLAVLLPVTAAAQQMTAKDAWDALRALAADNGMAITAQGVSDFGTALEARGVHIFPTDEPNAMVIGMADLRVEPRGDMIALIPSETITVDTLFAGGVTRGFEIHQAGEIRGNLTDDSAALDLDFGTVSMRLVSSNRRGAPLAEAFDVDLTGFDGSLRATRDGTAEVTLGFDGSRYDYSLPQGFPGSGGAVAASGATEAIRVTFSGAELDMLGGLEDTPGALRAAFDAGFHAHFSMETEGGTGSSQQTIEGAPVSMTTQSGPSSMTLDIVDGRFDLDMTADAAQFSGSYAGVAGSLGLDGMGVSIGGPLVVTPDLQPARYAFHLDNVTPSPELLALVNAGDFAGESLSLALDIRADARLTRELGPDFGEGATPPFDLDQLRLDQVLLQVGDSAFTGNGAATLIGGMAAQIGRGMPNANGDFTFDLVGGQRLLDRLTALGLVPQDQLFFVRMMMNGLGQPVGEDHLRSEVALRPGGQITVNGAPLPF